MTDPAEEQEQSTTHRGEAAWKEHTERIAARNDRARKAGKARREAAERARNRALRKRERLEMAALVGRRSKP
jgi:hypothetical protein